MLPNRSYHSISKAVGRQGYGDPARVERAKQARRLKHEERKNFETPVGSLPFQQLANRARDLGTGARLEADFCHATDMEGVGGVNNADEQLLPGQRRYEESRRLLTGEVNAAVVGALEAGASQVVIWDGHDASLGFATGIIAGD
jgi:hypothetical protein